MIIHKSRVDSTEFMRSSFTGLFAAVALVGIGLAWASIARAADCRGAVTHVPDADVTYSPGRDVRGGPVAPADLPDPGRIRPPDSVTIDIKGLTRVPGSSDKLPLVGEVDAGRVTVDRAGRVTYEGQKVAPSGDCR